MKLNKKVLLIAILFALITVGVLNNYINTLKKETIKPVERTQVVTALNTIPNHVVITKDMLSTISIPSELVHSEAVLDSSKIIGKSTNSEIIKGEQLLKSRVVTEGLGSSLSYQIPDKMRAITISADEISGVGGYIVSGDKIDILVSYSELEINTTKVLYTHLQNIEVLEVGPNVLTTEKQESGVASSLTVIVTPEQAEVVAFAAVNGNFHFTLRNPMDKAKSTLDQFGLDNFNVWRDR